MSNPHIWASYKRPALNVTSSVDEASTTQSIYMRPYSRSSSTRRTPHPRQHPTSCIVIYMTQHWWTYSMSVYRQSYKTSFGIYTLITCNPWKKELHGPTIIAWKWHEAGKKNNKETAELRSVWPDSNMRLKSAMTKTHEGNAAWGMSINCRRSAHGGRANHVKIIQFGVGIRRCTQCKMVCSALFESWLCLCCRGRRMTLKMVRSRQVVWRGQQKVMRCLNLHTGTN